MSVDDDLCFEFQPIILAAGKGSRMTQLLHGKPKCLLPIVNKPMIQYPLELLVKSNIKNTILVVLDSEEELIRSAIHRINFEIQIDFFVIPHSEDHATADTLRLIQTKVKKDLLVLPCDIISDVDLRSVIQFYRLKDPTFLCVLSSIPQVKENLVPVKKLMPNREYDYIGFDKEDPDRLVLFDSDVMFSDAVPLKKSMLHKCSNFVLQTDLLDSHIYLIKHWVLDYLNTKPQIKSIKSDFIPSLVRRQFRQKKEQHETDNIFNYLKRNLVDLQLEKLNCAEEEDRNNYPSSLVSCYAYVIDSGYCIRSNDWLGFCEANRVMSERVPRTSPISRAAMKMQGNRTVIGEDCILKRTIIGSNCVIKDRVKLTNCIILDNVTIEDDCCLQSCVLCYDGFVGNGTELKDCVVGPGQKIAPESRFSNESLTEEMLDL